MGRLGWGLEWCSLKAGTDSLCEVIFVGDIARAGEDNGGLEVEVRVQKKGLGGFLRWRRWCLSIVGGVLGAVGASFEAV